MATRCRPPERNEMGLASMTPPVRKCQSLGLPGAGQVHDVPSGGPGLGRIETHRTATRQCRQLAQGQIVTGDGSQAERRVAPRPELRLDRQPLWVGTHGLAVELGQKCGERPRFRVGPDRRDAPEFAVAFGAVHDLDRVRLVAQVAVARCDHPPLSELSLGISRTPESRSSAFRACSTRCCCEGIGAS